jgi:Acetyltransferase (isoleucine patch superfamily)
MLGKLFRGIGYLSSFFYTESISDKIQKIRINIYTGWLKRRFKLFDGQINGRIELHDPQCVSVGKNTIIQGGVKLLAWTKLLGETYSPQIIIGDNSSILDNCFISAIDRIEIGDNVAVTGYTMILDNVHGDFQDNHLTFNKNPEVPDVFLKNAFTRPLASKGPVIIENDVHIGMYCLIMPGTVIGHHSVIAAHSVVARKIPPYSLVAGNPAEVIMTFGRKKKKQQ